jgi:hypothetical protein
VVVKIKIIRVFPERNSYTPDDEYCFFDVPGLFIPDHDEVHVCCVFTWDIKRCEYLKSEWEVKTDKPVKIGGPAFGDGGGGFIPGMYVRKGITFCSQGCNNSCKWCFVPEREGKLKEIDIQPGNVIQDNNFLQCSKQHRAKAYEMLKTQRQIIFRGGLQPDLLTDWDIEQMQGLRIKELWLACDTKGKVEVVKRTCERLYKAGFNRNKIRCYALIGDDIKENESRLRKIFLAGAMPFAQLFQPAELEKKKYSREWTTFQRTWQRPAATKAYMKSVLIEVVKWQDG